LTINSDWEQIALKYLLAC